MPRMALTTSVAGPWLAPAPATPAWVLAALAAGLTLLALALRHALTPHRKALAIAVVTEKAIPAAAPARSWRWILLDRLAALLEAIEGDDDVPVLAPAPRTFTLDGTAYRLPAGPPPRAAHKRTSSLKRAPAPPDAALAQAAPLSSPPPQAVFSPPPTMRQLHGAPVSGARPISAAKLIMSRHVVRKPYRSPPLPGQPRTTPVSRLAS